MRPVIQVVCDRVDQSGGNLSLINSMDKVGARHLPVKIETVVLFVKFELSREDLGRTIPFAAEMIDPDGRQQYVWDKTQAVLPRAEAGGYAWYAFMTPFSELEFASVGVHEFVLHADGKIVATVPVEVVMMREDGTLVPN